MQTRLWRDAVTFNEEAKEDFSLLPRTSRTFCPKIAIFPQF